MTERYGADFAADQATDWYLAHPEKASWEERAVATLIYDLGQEIHRDYRREYRIAPGLTVDFAWPARRKVLEVFGSWHDSPFKAPVGGKGTIDAERIVRLKNLGWDVLVVRSQEVAEPYQWVATRARLWHWLQAAPEQQEIPHHD